MAAVPNNAMDLLSYSAMSSWLNIFPFGMLPPTPMFNPMMPSQPMAAKPQPANSLASPPLLTSPTLDTNTMMSRQHSVPSNNPTQVNVLQFLPAINRYFVLKILTLTFN